MINKEYRKQAALLLDVLPEVAKETCFAMHGGTAINLFIRDMPRLSVDIDLTYLPIENRELFLKNITTALITLAQNIKQKGVRYQIGKVFTKEPEQLSKLIVSNDEARVIIEPNLVLRGSVFKP